jgi:hypothetical protein
MAEDVRMNATCIACFRLPLAPNIAVELLTILLPNREVTARLSILGLTMLVEFFVVFLSSFRAVSI